MKLENQVCSEFRTLRDGGYFAIHKWLIKHFGKANKCESPFCSGILKRYQWCKLKNKKYEHKRENYVMLCACCHRNYDDTSKWRGNVAKRYYGKHSKKTKQRISESMKKYRRDNSPWNSKNK